MVAQLIDGKAIAKELRENIAREVAEMVANGYNKPGLATVLVGEDPASEVYVRMKQRACAKLGIESVGHNLSADVSQEEVERLVSELNANPAINGILFSCHCRGIWMKRKCLMLSAWRGMWMVSTQSTWEGLLRKDANHYLCLARQLDVSI